MELIDPEIYESYDDAREQITGEEDDVTFYNPGTGRPLKKYNNYNEVLMYSKNTRLGYHGIAHLVKTKEGVALAYEIFDQAGELTFNEMMESIE